MRVYVARHGETTWNLAGRYQGRLESPLSPLGERQADALADAMADRGVQRVISSPLGRCMETARPTALRQRVTLETDPLLLEIAHGTWEGRLRDEIAANDPQRYHAWRNDPANVGFDGGETLVDVRDRWRAFAAALQADAPTLVVTHDAVVRVALVEGTGGALGGFWDARVANGAFAEFDVDAHGWRLIVDHHDAHLGALKVSVEGQAL
jgi:probable phosphoglycerate mutase